jgi:hypothetical protein
MPARLPAGRIRQVAIEICIDRAGNVAGEPLLPARLRLEQIETTVDDE